MFGFTLRIPYIQIWLSDQNVFKSGKILDFQTKSQTVESSSNSVPMAVLTCGEKYRGIFEVYSA
jgi:hypothetical protein